MKPFPLLPLVAFVFAIACTDATAPANSHALLSLKDPALELFGDPPPPPVDAFLSDGETAIPVLYFFIGNPDAIGDPGLSIGFIRFLPPSPIAPDRISSPDARIMFVQGSFLGRGTLTIDETTIDLSTASFDGSSFTACTESCGRLVISQGETQKSFTIFPAISRDTFCGAICQSTGGDEGLIIGHE